MASDRDTLGKFISVDKCSFGLHHLLMEEFKVERDHVGAEGVPPP